MAKKAHSLAYTKWMCKYHIVSTPKYRRKVVCNQYKEGIPPKISVSSFMGYLQGKSALMIFDKLSVKEYADSFRGSK